MTRRLFQFGRCRGWCRWFLAVVAVAFWVFPTTAGASVASGPPWVVEEVISEDLPSCVSDIVSHEQTEEILILTNDCSEPVTLSLLECTEIECDGDSVILVPGGEAMGIYSEDLGLSDDEIAAGTTFTATLGWSRADDEGIVELRLRRGEWEESSRGCGCHASSVGRGLPVGPVFWLVVLGVGVGGYRGSRRW